jgi:hypothetical protein
MMIVDRFVEIFLKNSATSRYKDLKVREKWWNTRSFLDSFPDKDC